MFMNLGPHKAKIRVDKEKTILAKKARKNAPRIRKVKKN